MTCSAASIDAEKLLHASTSVMAVVMSDFRLLSCVLLAVKLPN